MKTSYLFGAAVAATSIAALVERADAATAGAFTFETSGVALAGTTATGSSYSVVADVGVGTMLLTHGGASGTGATYTSPIGNGSARSFSSSRWRAPDSYLFSVPTTGLTDIMVSFDMTSDANGPKNFGVGFSSNGGAGYTTIAGYSATFSSSTGFGAASNAAFRFSFDFSAFTSINQNSQAVFRLQNLDSTFGPADGGTNFIDNFVVTGTAVPEPATMGLALVAVGGLLARRPRN